MSEISQLFKRDLLLALRNRYEVANSLLFFVVIVILFPLAVGPDKLLLQALGPGVIWVAALLSHLLSLNQLFSDDFSDGSLDQILVTPASLPLLGSAKILAHWLVTGLPLVVVAPLLAVFFYLPLQAVGVLLVSLLLGTPILSWIGAIGSALTVGLRQGGLLLSLLILPLYVPVLIFGAGMVVNAVAQVPVMAQVALLGALLILTLTFAPWGVAAALRIGVE